MNSTEKFKTCVVRIYALVVKYVFCIKACLVRNSV